VAENNMAIMVESTRNMAKAK